MYSPGSTPHCHLAGTLRNGPRATEGTQGNRDLRSVAPHRPSDVQEEPERRAATGGFLHCPLGWVRY